MQPTLNTPVRTPVSFLKPILIPRILDDAGVEHELFDPHSADQDPTVVDLSLRILEEHRRPKGWNSRVSSVEMIGPFAGAFGLMIAQSAGVLTGLGSLGAPLALFPGLMAGRWLTWRAVRAECAELTRTTLMAFGRCPACAYAIGDLERDASGLIRCPECRAAWKAERLGPVSSPPPGAAAASRWSWMDLMPTVTDRAGRLRRLADPAAAAARRPELDGLAARVRAATRVRRWSGLALYLAAPFVLFAIPLSMQWGMAAAPAWAAGGPPPGLGALMGAGSWNGLFATVAFAVTLFMGARLGWREFRGRGGLSASMTRRMALGDGRCPACLERMFDADSRGIEIAPRCGACGAVWSLTDVPLLPNRLPSVTDEARP